jgi:4-amino-4-deoxy-L-arabinose transferase-like glycosyltransferase
MDTVTMNGISTKLLAPEAEQNRSQAGLLTIALLATAARVGAVLFVGNFDNPQVWEGGEIARNMLAGMGFSFHTAAHQVVPSAYMPPAYSYILLFIFRVFGDNRGSYVLLQLLQAASSAFLVYLVYKLALVGWDHRVAVTAALITALYPPFIYMPTEMHPISFYIVITLASIYFIDLYWVREPRLEYAIYGSLLLGLLLYFRAEALALPVLFSAILIVKSKSNWRAAPVIVVVPVLCLLPWTIRNYRLFGELVPSTTAGGIALWYGHNPQATGTQRTPWPSGEVVQPDASLMKKFAKIPVTPTYELRMSDIYRDTAIQYARTHPQRELVLTVKKVFYFWTIDWNHPKARRLAYCLPSLTMVGLFLVGAVRERKSLFGKHLVLTVAILFSNVLAVVLFVLPRYRMVVEPIMIPFAAAALVWAQGTVFPARGPGRPSIGFKARGSWKLLERVRQWAGGVASAKAGCGVLSTIMEIPAASLRRRETRPGARSASLPTSWAEKQCCMSPTWWPP